MNLRRNDYQSRSAAVALCALWQEGAVLAKRGGLVPSIEKSEAKSKGWDFSRPRSTVWYSPFAKTRGLVPVKPSRDFCDLGFLRAPGTKSLILAENGVLNRLICQSDRKRFRKSQAPHQVRGCTIRVPLVAKTSGASRPRRGAGICGCMHSKALAVARRKAPIGEETP